MANLLKQGVHSYITQLVSEVLGPAETGNASAQIDLTRDPASKEKPIVNEAHHRSNPVRSTKFGE